MRTVSRLGAAAFLLVGVLFADVTYKQDTKFEGGTLVDMMQKMAHMPLMGHLGGDRMKQAFEDQHFDVYLKGNKMARWGQSISSIYDLDAGTVTNIDNAKKTYNTFTFEELQQRMEEAQKRMSRGQTPDIDFDVTVKQTGETRTIEGATATETLIVMTAKQASAQGKMVVTTHAWLEPVTPATRELADFQKKLGQRFAYAYSAGGPGMMGTGKGLSAAMKEAMKLDGYPVQTETSISGVTAPAGPMGGGDSDPNAPLLQLLTQNTHVAQAGVDDSKFAIPAGFKEEKHK